MNRPDLEVLRDMNPWWRGEGVPRARDHPWRRTAFDVVLERLHPDRAQLLLGPRQVGKTVLLYHVAEHLLRSGVPPASILYCDFDDPRLGPAGLRTVRDWTPGGDAEGSTRIYLFDEVHSSPDWDRHLRRLVDEKAGTFLVADSAAHALATARSDSGSGRFDEVRLGPLTFAEFVTLTQPQRDTRIRTMPAAEERPSPLVRSERCDRYLFTGGFPGLVANPSMPEVHRLLREDVAQRALFRDLSWVRRPFALQSLFLTLVVGSGRTVSISRLNRDLGVSRETLTEWLSLLETTRLLHRIPPFTRSGVPRPTGSAKMIAADPGLVAALTAVPRAAEDPGLRGRLVETAVHLHLDRGVRSRAGEVAYFRKGNLEADFVAVMPSHVLPVEVTGALRVDRRKQECLARAANAIGAGRALLVSGAEQGGHRSTLGVELELVSLHTFLWALSVPGHPDESRWLGAGR